MSYFLYHDPTSLLDLAHHSLKNILMIFSHVFAFLTCYKSGESWKNIEIPINKEQHWQQHQQRSLFSALWTWHNHNTKPNTIWTSTRIDSKSDPRPNSCVRKSRVKLSTIELFQNEIRKLHYTGLKKEIFMIIDSKKFCTSHEQEIGPISNC